jgi:hypothetical protein
VSITKVAIRFKVELRSYSAAGDIDQKYEDLSKFQTQLCDQSLNHRHYRCERLEDENSTKAIT